MFGSIYNYKAWNCNLAKGDNKRKGWAAMLDWHAWQGRKTTSLEIDHRIQNWKKDCKECYLNATTWLGK
jgi:hypothetical protein